MQVSDIQMLLANVHLYKGAIDGDAGPKTWAAVTRLEQEERKRYVDDPETYSSPRRLIAAGQAVLDRLGFEPGLIDGFAGHNTLEALTAWRSAKAGISALLERAPVTTEIRARSHSMQERFPRERDMPGFYGPAGGPQCTAGKVKLAYPMRLSWDKSQIIRRFSCHEKVVEPLTRIFQETLRHYGESDIGRLGLDLFGGCFNYRKKRGGSTLSTHAYGVAVDLNPEQNRLRWGADRAQFARPEYEPFWNIVIAHGATPAGYAWGKDWMHFQFARL